MLTGAVTPKPATWAIVLIKDTPAAVIGHVEAPADSAIKVAIRQFNISDPEQQKRLAARILKAWCGSVERMAMNPTREAPMEGAREELRRSSGCRLGFLLVAFVV